MDKIKTVKIKNLDGSISEETYTISVDAKDVDMKNGKNLQNTIGNIDIDRDGNIAEQLSRYQNYDEDIETLYENTNNLEIAKNRIENDIINLQINKIDKIDIIDDLNDTSSTKVLSANQGKILNDKVKQKTYFFNSVIDMKEANLQNGDFVYTLGYHTVNDGGAANYKIVNNTTNYKETLNNGLYAELIIDDKTNVKQFGAYGDGETDDTYIIQRAIDNTSKLIIPTGVYIFTILSINNNNIILKGDNNSVLKGKRINVIGNNITLQNIKYNGNLDSTGIDVTGSHITFDGCEIYNIKNNDGTLGRGIDFRNMSYGIVKNCYFHDFESGNESAAVGIDDGAVRCIRTNSSQYINIYDNKFENFSGHKDGDMISIQDGNLGTVDNNYPYSGTTRADLKDIKIYNNTFIQEDCKSTIKVQSSNTEIYNNLFILNNKTTSHLAVIRVQGGDNNNVFNNIFEIKTGTQNYNYIIDYNKCGNSVISDNIFNIKSTTTVNPNSGQSIFYLVSALNIEISSNRILCGDIRYINYWDSVENINYTNNNIILKADNTKPTFIRVLNTLSHVPKNIYLKYNQYDETESDPSSTWQSLFQINPVENIIFEYNNFIINRFGNLTSLQNMTNFKFNHNKVTNINISNNIKYFIYFTTSCSNLEVLYNETNIVDYPFIRCYNAIQNLKFSSNANYNGTQQPIYRYTDNDNELYYYKSDFKGYGFDYGYNPVSANYQDGHVYFHRTLKQLLTYYDGAWYDPSGNIVS